jgi:hypothetical protein
MTNGKIHVLASEIDLMRRRGNPQIDLWMALRKPT